MITDVSNSSLHETIGLIYDSALDPAVWPRALEAMCLQIDGCHGSISVLDTTRRQISFATEWSSTPDWPTWRKLLDEKYAALRLPAWCASCRRRQAGPINPTERVLFTFDVNEWREAPPCGGRHPISGLS